MLPLGAHDCDCMALDHDLVPFFGDCDRTHANCSITTGFLLKAFALKVAGAKLNDVHRVHRLNLSSWAVFLFRVRFWDIRREPGASL